MEEMLHQLRLVVFPINYKVLYIPGRDRQISEPSTVHLQKYGSHFHLASRCCRGKRKAR